MKPKLYYGLHMAEGTAEYKKSDGAYRILIRESAIKKMDKTMQGIPVIVNHVDDEIDYKNIDHNKDIDGWVVRSFFNKSDGKHWAEFMVTTQRGEDALRQGYRLSNCYIPKQYTNGGEWHGVQYAKEVTDAEYEHLAIVKNPRYPESIVLTPEEFKLYNEKKELELERLANSKDEKVVEVPKQNGEKRKMKFNMFKREKVEKLTNETDIESLVVELPKSKKEYTYEMLVNKSDEAEMKNGFANGEDKVKVGEKDMTVNELVEYFKNSEKEKEEMKNSKGKKNADMDAEKEEDPSAKEKKENKKKNSSDEDGENHFEKLKNAADKAQDQEVKQIFDGVAIGKKRYGA